MGVDMSNNRFFSTKNLFPSPALSLSLAGIFKDVEMEDAAEISSENSGPVRSRSEDDFDGVGVCEDDEGHGNGGEIKRRKKYHRHTSIQIKEMEALFKESPHPDEKQRQQLSKRLGLSSRQVKFWFQNRRTQIKAIQERHENSLLKAEIEKLREENKAMREISKNKVCCPNCGFAGDTPPLTNSEKLRVKNGKLKVQVHKLRSALSSPSYSAGNEEDNRTCLDFYTGIFGMEKSSIIQKVHQAFEELETMATADEPLWVRSVETGREILNYDEYVRTFHLNNSKNGQQKRYIEASRETAVVFMEPSRLVKSFMDVNQWKEMFPFMIAKAALLDIISNGEDSDSTGVVQLMFAEVQMLTPMVATREVYFIRHCRKLDGERWAVVDVSIENIDDDSEVKWRKRPSGLIIDEESNGHCKVRMVEHLECQKNTVQKLYRCIVNNGAAFGARHWMATLQLQCERLAFSMATNIPMKDSTGVGSLAGRKSSLKLAQRMTSSFCQAVAASSFHSWTKLPTKTGEDIRVSSRKNLNDPGEPIGIILCAVSSVWFPLSPLTLFHFLRDEAHRNEWDTMFSGDRAQSIANLAKGQDRGNAVTIQTTSSKESKLWILQDSSINSFESMVVYSRVEASEMQSVMTGHDSGNVSILPSGFSILSDGVESRPVVVNCRKEKKMMDSEGGTLLTLGIQILSDTSVAAKPTMESVEYVKSVICCTLKNIRTSLQCEDD